MGQPQHSAWKFVSFDVRIVLIGSAVALPTVWGPAFGDAGPEGQGPGIAGRAEWVVEEPSGEPIPESPFRECPTCPEMVVVPAGSFRMGCVSGLNCGVRGKPVHRVTISAPLAVGKYEATFAEWEACVADGGVTGIGPTTKVGGGGTGR